MSSILWITSGHSTSDRLQGRLYSPDLWPKSSQDGGIAGLAIQPQGPHSSFAMLSVIEVRDELIVDGRTEAFFTVRREPKEFKTYEAGPD